LQNFIACSAIPTSGDTLYFPLNEIETSRKAGGFKPKTTILQESERDLI
jgi:hypothetical protein